MEECFKKAVEQLGQIASGAQVSPGRVIRVQEGAVLLQCRIRVIEGFNKPRQETIAEAISDTGAAQAITDALAIEFGVTDVYEGGTFNEQKNTVRYTPSGSIPMLFEQATPEPLLRVKRSDSLLSKIDQVRLRAEEMEVTEGRVMQVEFGGWLDQKRLILVIDDFGKSYQNTIARVVCTESVAEAIAATAQLHYGAEKIIERGRFVEEKAGLRYQIPKSSETRHSANIVSENTSGGRGF